MRKYIMLVLLLNGRVFLSAAEASEDCMGVEPSTYRIEESERYEWGFFKLLPGLLLNSSIPSQYYFEAGHPNYPTYYASLYRFDKDNDFQIGRSVKVKCPLTDSEKFERCTSAKNNIFFTMNQLMKHMKVCEAEQAMTHKAEALMTQEEKAMMKGKKDVIYKVLVTENTVTHFIDANSVTLESQLSESSGNAAIVRYSNPG